MKLYTSYFAQLRNFPPTLVALSTAHWNPKWLTPGRDKNGALWLDCPPLKPGNECEGLCAGKCVPKHPQDCDFLKVYRRQLDKIDIKNFLATLEKLAEQIKAEEHLDYVDFAFIVYETPRNSCSEREVILQWLHDNNIECEEWHK